MFNLYIRLKMMYLFHYFCCHLYFASSHRIIRDWWRMCVVTLKYSWFRTEFFNCVSLASESFNFNLPVQNLENLNRQYCLESAIVASTNWIFFSDDLYFYLLLTWLKKLPSEFKYRINTSLRHFTTIRMPVIDVLFCK